MESQKDLPQDLLYDNDYSWVKISQEEATLGIVQSAASKVQEFVFVDLPERGQKIKKGDTYASLEAVKWSGHLSSPLSGEVTDVNDKAFDEPGIINQDPYGQGWLVKIRLSDPEEKKELLAAGQKSASS
jgi:glycine cleavage system H protein